MSHEICTEFASNEHARRSERMLTSYTKCASEDEIALNVQPMLIMQDDPKILLKKLQKMCTQ